MEALAAEGVTCSSSPTGDYDSQDTCNDQGACIDCIKETSVVCHPACQHVMFLRLVMEVMLVQLIPSLQWGVAVVLMLTLSATTLIHVMGWAGA